MFPILSYVTQKMSPVDLEKKNKKVEKIQVFQPSHYVYEHASIYTDVQTVLMSYVTQKINVTCGS